MSHGKQRKLDAFVKATEPNSSSNEEVLTTSTEHKSASGNISEKSNADIDVTIPQHLPVVLTVTTIL